MKRAARRKNRKLFRVYLVSYISIAFFVLAVTGMSVNYLSAREMAGIQRENTKERLEIAATALNRQINTLENISLDICTSAVFLPAHIQQGISYEWKMMDALGGYANYLPFPFSYYLCYPQERCVYSDSAKYNIEDFLHYVCPLYQREVALARANPGRLYAAGPETLVIVFESRKLRNVYEFVVFIPNRSMLDYAANVSGLPVSSMSLLLTGDETDETACEHAADSGYGMSILLQSDESRTFERVLIMTLPVMLAMTMICLGAAVYLSWSNYLPIRQLMSRVELDGQESMNELELIDRQFSAVLSENSRSRKELREMTLLLEKQRRELRDRLLWQMLYKGYNEPISAGCRNMGITLPGQCTALTQIHDVQPEAWNNLSQEIEELSGLEDIAFYALSEEEGKMLVLINAMERVDIFSGMNLMQTLLPENGRITLLGVCGSLNDISDLAEYLGTEQADEAGSPSLAEENERMSIIITEIESGNEKEAVACIHEMEMEMELTELRPRTILGLRAELASRLYQLACQGSHSLAKEQISSALLASSTKEEYLSLVISAVRLLSQQHESALGNRGAQRTEDILEYIQQHLSDWELSLESIAEHFQVSQRVVSMDIKRKTGMNYIAYVKAERMQLACRMLVETEDSVVKIGNAIGYSNISYFIRIFRECTGMTPVIYRNTAMSLRENVPDHV